MNFFEIHVDLCVDILKFNENPEGKLDKIQTATDLIIENMKLLNIEYVEPIKKTIYKCPHIECGCSAKTIKASIKYQQRKSAGLIINKTDKVKNQQYYQDNRERILFQSNTRNHIRKQELIEYNAKYYKEQKQLMTDTKKELKRLQNEIDKLNPIKIALKKQYSKTYLD